MEFIDNQWVCVECTLFIANGDAPDEDWDEEDSGPRLRAIIDGHEAGSWVIGAPDKGDSEIEFSVYDCDCCGSAMAGSRNHAFLRLN